MIHVDTNVIVDVLSGDKAFGLASTKALREAGIKIIGPLVFAELTYGLGTSDAVDRALSRLDIQYAEMSKQALSAAGTAFRNYRERGGTRASILPDFFIGAHAFVTGCSLLTRDPTRYRTAFPKLGLIEP